MNVKNLIEQTVLNGLKNNDMKQRKKPANKYIGTDMTGIREQVKAYFKNKKAKSTIHFGIIKNRVKGL